MKKIKCGLIVSDFDGTLLTSSHSVPEEVRRAIDEYRSHGGIFAVCTGRMLRSILPRVRELGLKGIVVAYQGTVIADIESGKIIKNGGMGSEATAEVCRYLEAVNATINVYSGDHLYTNIPKDNKYLKLYENITGVEAESVQDCLMSEFVLKHALYCQKVASLVSSKQRDALYSGLNGALGDRFDVTCSADVLVEVSPFGENKGSALEFLAKHYAIPLSSSVAIGDNLNDMSMILRAGVGVAVGNAVQALKDAADYVAVTNDECAVAKVIEKFGYE